MMDIWCFGRLHLLLDCELAKTVLGLDDATKRDEFPDKATRLALMLALMMRMDGVIGKSTSVER